MKDLLRYLSEYCRCDSLMLILLLKSTLMRTVYVIGNCINKMALYKQALRKINDLKQPVVARVSRRDSQRGCSWNSQTLLSGKHILYVVNAQMK